MSTDADDFLASLRNMSLSAATSTIGKKRRPPATKMPNAVHQKGGIMAGMKGGTVNVNVTVGANGVAQVNQTFAPAGSTSIVPASDDFNVPGVVSATPGSYSSVEALQVFLNIFQDKAYGWMKQTRGDRPTDVSAAEFDQDVLNTAMWQEYEQGGPGKVDFGDQDMVDWVKSKSSGKIVAEMVNMDGWDYKFDYVLDPNKYDSAFNVKVFVKKTGEFAITVIDGD